MRRFTMLGLMGIILSVSMTGTMPAWAQAPTYVGSSKCKLCHMKPHKIWSDSEHAKAFDILKPADQKNPECLACHVTGYQAGQDVTPTTAGIGCEACHGPASGYLNIHPKKDKDGARRAGMVAKPDAESCKACHNPKSPTFKGFEYDKMWATINHTK